MQLHLFLSVVATAVFLAIPAYSANPGQPGFELEQSSILLGKVSVKVTPSAVQFINKGQGTVILSHAPAWNLLILNPRAKTYFECKVNAFSSSMTRGMTLMTGRTMTDVTYEPKPKKQADGLWHYISNAAYTKRETELYENLNGGSAQPKTADMWTDPKISSIPQVVAIAGRLYGFAVTEGMPVRVRYLDFDGDEKVFLSTQKITKRNLTDGDFERRLPSYRKAATLAEVYRTAATEAAMDEMLQGLESNLKR